MDRLSSQKYCDMDVLILSDSDDCGYSSDNVTVESNSCTFDYKENIQTIPKISPKVSNSADDRVRFPMLKNTDNENNILNNYLMIGEDHAKLDTSKSYFNKKSSDTNCKTLWKPYLKQKHEKCEDRSLNSESIRTKNFVKPFKKRSFEQLSNNEASQNNIEVSSSKFDPNLCLMCGKMDFIDDIENHLIFGNVSCSQCGIGVSTCGDFLKIVTNNHRCLNHVLVFSYKKLDSFINDNDLNISIEYLRTYLKVTRSVCNNRQFISSYSYFKSRLLFLEKGNKIEHTSSSARHSEDTNGRTDSSATESRKDGYRQKIVLHKIKSKDDNSHQINQWIIKKAQSNNIECPKPCKENKVFVHRYSEDCPQCYETFEIETLSFCIKTCITSLYCPHCKLTVSFDPKKLVFSLK